MKIKCPSGEVVDAPSRESLAKAIGEREGKMLTLNEDIKHLKKALRTFERFEVGEVDAPIAEDKPASVPMTPKAATG